ncbi:unnamed protein product [Medioppia subpectinata]|uniref:Protein FAM60A n=1 Tax=Medioppia subpectinata TaxID=1979941 RepID=A0A7R9Q3B6_9ACAR|nr:unnamed protein product [Medioppia subpectinata]CAG2111141.1 unnamed protein product [Medioppia subpectinata]
MFSFHKPKIYRSLSGCCICRAKSSSSRFTDSKKYEPEFEKCFQIIERRSGEICNACVLLVKRWKKLPTNTTRNWHHVVDARAGPGTKSGKSKPNDNSIASTATSLDQLNHSSNARKHVTHRKLLKPKIVDNYNMKGNDLLATDNETTVCESPTNTAITSFLDMSFWKKEKICCGVIFKGPDNEVLIYPKLLEPCCCRKRAVVIKPKLSAVVNSGSSDSGSIGSSVIEDDANSNASSGNISLI